MMRKYGRLPLLLIILALAACQGRTNEPTPPTATSGAPRDVSATVVPPTETPDVADIPPTFTPRASSAGVAAGSQPSGATVPIQADGVYYVVQAGDTLGIIADRYGLSVDRLVEANRLSNANQIAVGAVLLIPDQ